MKKLFSIVILMIVTMSILLSSCTEEEIKVDGDNNGKGRETGF